MALLCKVTEYITLTLTSYQVRQARFDQIWNTTTVGSPGSGTISQVFMPIFDDMRQQSPFPLFFPLFSCSTFITTCYEELFYSVKSGHYHSLPQTSIVILQCLLVTMVLRPASLQSVLLLTYFQGKQYPFLLCKLLFGSTIMNSLRRQLLPEWQCLPLTLQTASVTHNVLQSLSGTST